MKRWLIPLVAIISLVAAQPVLAAQPEQGVVRDFVNPPPPGCEHPEGIAASPNGLIYTAGITGNVESSRSRLDTHYSVSSTSRGRVFTSPITTPASQAVASSVSTQ